MALAVPRGRADHPHAFGQKRADIKRFEVRRVMQHGDVEPLLDQPLLQRTGDALAHVQRGLRPRLLETFGKMRDEDASGRRRHAECDAAALRRTVVLDLLAGLMHQMRDRLGALEQQRAGGGQTHAAAVPGKQRDAELVLQFLDLAAQRRLRQAQFLGRAADAAGARDLHEIAQLFELHRGSVSPIPQKYNLGHAMPRAKRRGACGKSRAGLPRCDKTAPARGELAWP